MVSIMLLAVLVLVSVDLGMFKDRIEVLVTDLLDRELRIDGELHASVGSSIELYAEDVYLANPDWAGDDAFVVADKIDISIDLWSLLRGPIEIERVEVAGVRVNIEKNAEGDASWIFPGLETAVESDAEEVAPRAGLPAIIYRADINDARVSYDGPEMAEPLLFIADSLRSKIDADIFSVELVGSLNGTPLHFVNEISPVENLLEYENVSADVTGNIGEITIRGSAWIDNVLAPRRTQGKLEIAGPNAGYLTDVLLLEPITTGPLQLSLSIEESGEQMLASLAGAFGEFDIAADGQFQDIQELGDVDLTFTADGPDIGTIIRILGREYTDSDPFDIHGRISRTGSEVTVEDVVVVIGASNLTIDGFFPEYPIANGGRLTLAASGPDYGRFNRLFGMPGQLEGAFTTSLSIMPNDDGRDRVAFDANTPHFKARVDSLLSSADEFDGTTIQLEITGPDIGTIARAAGFDGLPDDDFRITASVEKDSTGFVVENLEALINDDVFKMSGHIGNKPLAGETDFEIDFSGPDLGASVIAFGGTAELTPKGGYYLRGKVQKQDDKLWLRGISVAIGDADEYQFQMSGFLTTGEQFVDSQITVEAQGASLAVLGELVRVKGFPDFPFDVSANIRRGRSNTYIENGIFTSENTAVDFAATVGDNPLEDDLALTFSASLPMMKNVIEEFGIDVEMFPGGDLVASGSIRQEDGQISIEQFAVLFGGANLQITGDIGQPPSLSGTNLRFELDGNDLSRLLPPSVSGESWVHAFAASGRMSLGEDMMEVNQLRANIGHTTFGGDFALGLDPFLGSGSFTVKADSPDLHQLFPKMKEVSVPQVAKMKYRGSGNWAENFWSIENFRLELGDGYLETSGSLDGPPSFARTDLDFEWVASSLSNLSVIAGRELPDHPFRLKAHLVGTSDVMTMEDFELTFGESDLDGQFTMRAGDRPAVKIDVKSRLLDISEYLPAPDEDPQPEATVADDRVIPDAPLPLELLKLFDADIDIEIDELRTRNFRMYAIALDALVSAGALEIRDLSYDGQRGGALALSGALIPNESGGADFSFTADGKDIVMAVRAKTDQDLQTLPSFEIRADLTATGKTARDLAGTMDGYVRVVGSAGRVPSGSLSFLTQDFAAELINTINPFTKSDPYTNVECGVVLMHFDDGLLSGDPMLVQQTDKLRIFASSKINLKTEKLNVDFRMEPRKGLGISLSGLVNPYIKLTGTLGKPALVLDPQAALIEGGAAVATAGLSVIAKSFKNRFLSEKDPCGKALEEADKKFAARKNDE